MGYKLFPGAGNSLLYLELFVRVYIPCFFRNRYCIQPTANTDKRQLFKRDSILYFPNK